MWTWLTCSFSCSCHSWASPPGPSLWASGINIHQRLSIGNTYRQAPRKLPHVTQPTHRQVHRPQRGSQLKDFIFPALCGAHSTHQNNCLTYCEMWALQLHVCPLPGELGTGGWRLPAPTSVSGINSSLEVSLISYSTIRGVILFYLLLFF